MPLRMPDAAKRRCMGSEIAQRQNNYEQAAAGRH
jgi:hypothetical protein